MKGNRHNNLGVYFQIMPENTFFIVFSFILNCISSFFRFYCMILIFFVIFTIAGFLFLRYFRYVFEMQTQKLLKDTQNISEDSRIRVKILLLLVMLRDVLDGLPGLFFVDMQHNFRQPNSRRMLICSKDIQNLLHFIQQINLVIK